MVPVMEAIEVKELVDKITEWDELLCRAKEEKAKLESQLQAIGLEQMQHRKVKTVQLFGSKNNYVLVQKARKVDILNFNEIQHVLGEKQIASFIKVVTDPSYSPLKKFKEMAGAVFFDEFDNISVEYVLQQLGLESAQIALAKKKIKGDYQKDKAFLHSLSLGLTDEALDGWIFHIHEARINEMLLDAFSKAGITNEESYLEAVQSLKNSVFVEETPKITVKYE